MAGLALPELAAVRESAEQGVLDRFHALPRPEAWRASPALVLAWLVAAAPQLLARRLCRSQAQRVSARRGHDDVGELPGSRLRLLHLGDHEGAEVRVR
eukprot:10868239-Alexandrium_andersonii.AAC.1